MLFFELFAPFMALLSVIVVVGLYVMERRARRDPSEQPRRILRRRAGSGDRQTSERVRRPSMLP